MERTSNTKVLLIFILFLAAFLVTTKGGNEVPMKGEVYQPQFFGWPFGKCPFGGFPGSRGIPNPGASNPFGLYGFGPIGGLPDFGGIPNPGGPFGFGPIGGLPGSRGIPNPGGPNLGGSGLPNPGGPYGFDPIGGLPGPGGIPTPGGSGLPNPGGPGLPNPSGPNPGGPGLPNPRGPNPGGPYGSSLAGGLLGSRGIPNLTDPKTKLLHGNIPKGDGASGSQSP